MEFNGILTVSYIIATILFILALGGLSHQETARRGNWYGIVGMAVAVLATMFGPGQGLWWLSIILIAGGAGSNVIIGNRIGKTRLPAPMKTTSRPPSPLAIPPLACIRVTMAAISTTAWPRD